MGKIMSLLIVSLMTITLARPSVCHDMEQDIVDAHNAARAEVNVGPILWDESVATYARDYANQRIEDCGMIHSGGPYGENLAWGSWDMSGTEAVNMWVSEKSDYDYNSNTCAEDKACAHYTQVVWKDSVRVGCAKVQCNNGNTFITCNYDPPGNYIGQWPY